MKLGHADKHEAISRYLIQGQTLILIDARQPGVSVPEHLRREERLFLNLSHRFGTPLEVNGWGIRQVLSFGGVNYPCEVPWCAVYAARALNGEIEAWPAPGEPPPLVKRRGHLGVVH